MIDVEELAHIAVVTEDLDDIGAAAYALGFIEPNYPLPAITSKVEYIFGFGLADGIFIRIDDYIVAGAYRDGYAVVSYLPIPCEDDYPEF